MQFPIFSQKKMRLYLIPFLLVLCCSCSRTIYVVRHAEKAPVAAGSNMSATDPPLSDAGQQRAEALKEVMKSKKLGYIFSTNTIRTRSTAEPTRAHFGLTIETYPPFGDAAFFTKVKSLKKNALIVGHSNTLDNIVNGICGSSKIPGDLPESEYDHLFIIRKKGKNFIFEQQRYGAPNQ